jgi:hypothetical protein
MKLFQNIRKKVQTRRFILGVIVFLITLILCLIIFRNWDTLKAMILGS